MANDRDKYVLYERAVQSPESDVEFFDQTFEEFYKTKPEKLREDFCGTFQISCEWVKLRQTNKAIGLDIDEEPLQSGRKRHFAKLTGKQQDRLDIRQQSAVSVTDPKVDIVAACNFSYFLFKKRSELVEYFQCCYDSLEKQGILILDVLGGSENFEPNKTQRTIRPEKKEKWPKFVYIWQQMNFDPIHNQAEFYIHFKFKDGSKMQKVFHYDWRMWSLIELREAMEEVGFKETHVYWEGDDGDGGGDGEFERLETVKNCLSWVSYVVGVK